MLIIVNKSKDNKPLNLMSTDRMQSTNDHYLKYAEVNWLMTLLKQNKGFLAAYLAEKTSEFLHI